MNLNKRIELCLKDLNRWEMTRPYYRGTTAFKIGEGFHKREKETVGEIHCFILSLYNELTDKYRYSPQKYCLFLIEKIIGILEKYEIPTISVGRYCYKLDYKNKTAILKSQTNN